MSINNINHVRMPTVTRIHMTTMACEQDMGSEASHPHKKREAATNSQGIVVSKRKFVFKASSEYIKPDLGPDLLDGMELIYQNCGKAICQNVDKLTPRDNIIKFDPKQHEAEMKCDIWLDDTPFEILTELTNLGLFLRRRNPTTHLQLFFQSRNLRHSTSLLSSPQIWSTRN
jgi:hypothetical protein